MYVILKYKVSFISLIFYFILFFSSCSCNKDGDEQKKEGEKGINELMCVRETGVIRVVVDYNSINYFVYRGQPMGFQFELLNDLCQNVNVKPEFIVSNDINEAFKGLEQGRYDLIARNLTVTGDRKKLVDFTHPLMQTKQVIVQRKISGTDDKKFLKSIFDLEGKEIYVQRNSAHAQRLKHLSEEIGYDFTIKEDSINGIEQLIALVARGEIDYVVCDENMAAVNRRYYPNLNISLYISLPQNIAWAVKKGAFEWKNYINSWLKGMRESGNYQMIYKKYYNDKRIGKRYNSKYHSVSGGQISSFDLIIKELSEQYGWDWRLISSVIYHESRFDPTAESWNGATGLMQLMPNTALNFGIDDITDPIQNIKGGIMLIDWLDKQLTGSVPDSIQRVKFVLAAYNVGLGHVKDAQRLAEKYGKDKTIWDDNVAYFIQNKSAEKYYKDPVVRWGYCRGDEAYNFVNRVVKNYRHYQNLINE